MQGSPSIGILRIHIRTFGDEEFGDFFVTIDSCIMQRSRSIPSLRIHIRASIQVLFDGFSYSESGSIVDRFFSFQFFTRLAAVFSDDVGDLDQTQIPHSTTSCSMFIVFSPTVIFQAIHCSLRSHLSIANFLVLLSQSRGTLEPYRSPK